MEGLLGLFTKFGPQVMDMIKGGGIMGSDAPVGGGVPGGGAPGDAPAEGQMSPEQQKMMQSQQMGKNGQAQMQQMMQQGFSGAQNPGYKDMSNSTNMQSLMSMLMGMGGR